LFESVTKSWPVLISWLFSTLDSKPACQTIEAIVLLYWNIENRNQFGFASLTQRDQPRTGCILALFETRCVVRESTTFGFLEETVKIPEDLSLTVVRFENQHVAKKMWEEVWEQAPRPTIRCLAV
ncbi:MAG: hypothetical protein ACK5N9_01425, partial [Pirellula sp.]